MLSAHPLLQGRGIFQWMKDGNCSRPKGLEVWGISDPLSFCYCSSHNIDEGLLAKKQQETSGFGVENMWAYCPDVFRYGICGPARRNLGNHRDPASRRASQHSTNFPAVAPSTNKYFVRENRTRPGTVRDQTCFDHSFGPYEVKTPYDIVFKKVHDIISFIHMVSLCAYDPQSLVRR